MVVCTGCLIVPYCRTIRVDRLSTMYNNSLVNTADCVARCFANSPYVAKRAMATRTIHDRFFVFADNADDATVSRTTAGFPLGFPYLGDSWRERRGAVHTPRLTLESDKDTRV